MSNKNKKREGIVYSTNPDYSFSEAFGNLPLGLSPGEQKLLVRYETKGRGGKAATIVEGFRGSAAELEALGKQVKSHCGTGGSAKDGILIIQGDLRKKVLEYLISLGYQAKAGN